MSDPTVLPEVPPGTVTTTEAALLLRVSDRYVRQLAAEGALKTAGWHRPAGAGHRAIRLLDLAEVRARAADPPPVGAPRKNRSDCG